jgi:ABC-type amino acid transport substrate-binding protein
MNYYRLFTALFFTSVIVFALVIFSDAPVPKVIRIASGSSSGAYYRYACQLRDLLAEQGMAVEVVQTNGSLENARLISQSGGTTIGFIQGGVVPLGTSLRGVASLYAEPIWVFCRREVIEADLLDIAQGHRFRKDLGVLARKKVAVGPVDSGTNLLVRQLAKELEVISGPNAMLQQYMSFDEAAKKLEDGVIDGAVFVSGTQSPLVARLLGNDDLMLLTFDRFSAYQKEFSFLKRFSLCEGSVSLSRNLPSDDLNLLSVSANLVAHEQSHPAVIERVLNGCVELNRLESKSVVAGDYPAVIVSPTLSMHPTADRFLENGPSAASKVLPYWLLDLFNRLKIILLAFVPALLIATKGVPLIFDYIVGRQVFKHYTRLYELEVNAVTPELRESAVAELDELQAETARIKTTMRYRKDVYNLRLHIQLVRDTIVSNQVESKDEK